MIRKFILGFFSILSLISCIYISIEQIKKISWCYYMYNSLRYQSIMQEIITKSIWVFLLAIIFIVILIYFIYLIKNSNFKNQVKYFYEEFKSKSIESKEVNRDIKTQKKKEKLQKHLNDLEKTD